MTCATSSPTRSARFFCRWARSKSESAPSRAFWDNRDPDRLTPRNEFRDEHYRRVEEAKRRFGRGASRSGYLTERGEFYVLLGEPSRIEAFLGRREVVASEIWFYEGDTRRGFPPRFNLVFFQENDVGEYQLYSPLDDGPSALVRARVSLQQDRSASIDVLEIVSMDLARASLTVDLAEPVGAFLGRFTGLTPDGRPEDPTIPLNVRPSMSSNLVLGIARESGRSGVDTDYIDGYRRYGNRVSSEYSFKYISNRDYWTVLYGPRRVAVRSLQRRARPRGCDVSAERGRLGVRNAPSKSTSK